jgi:Na+-driven multidrug efflux pump
MCIEFLTLYVVRIPLAAVLIKTSLGLQGIWAAIGLSIVIQTAASLTCYFSGIWKKKKSKPKEEPILIDCPEEIG